MPGCYEDTGSSAYLFIPLQTLVFQRAGESASMRRSCALLRSRCENLWRTRHPRLRFMRTNENYIAR